MEEGWKKDKRKGVSVGGNESSKDINGTAIPIGPILSWSALTDLKEYGPISKVCLPMHRSIRQSVGHRIMNSQRHIIL